MGARHDCHVLSFVDEKQRHTAKEWAETLPGIRILGLFDLPAGPRLRVLQAKHILLGHPPSLARWQSRSLRQEIRVASTMNDYDLVHFDMINMAQYLPLINRIPAVLSLNDAIQMRYLRQAKTTKKVSSKLLANYKASRISSYETKALQNFTAVHVVSKVDADFLSARNPEAKNIETISLCVDPSFLHLKISQRKERNPRDQKAVIFTSGNLKSRYISEPLLAFVRNDLKRIHKELSNVELMVIGRDAPSEIERSLRSEPYVRFLPWVEDYAQALASSDIALFLDMSGGGVKNRVLQALAAGKPVVGTPIAFEGIDIVSGLNGFCCESGSQMAAAIIRLLGDAELGSRIGSEARDLVSRRYSPMIVGRLWETLYERLIEQSRRTPSGRAVIPTIS
jgi:glycosyltransferase involved in cell wall biosynthesis